MNKLGRASKWALSLAAGIAVLVAAYDPTPSTLALEGIGILVFAILGFLTALATKTGFLSRRIPPQIGLVLVSVSLSLGLCESVLRVVFFPAFPEIKKENQLECNLGYRYDTELGWFPIANGRTVFHGHRTVSIAHNSKGFRDNEPVIGNKPGIIFLGDSFVWGYDVEASERFTDKLQARHPEWAIYNFGVTGYSTDQEYLLLRKYFDQYHPELVFLVFCTENDDHGNKSNSGDGQYFKPYYQLEGGVLRLKGVPVPSSERVFCLHHPWLTQVYLVRLAVKTYAKLIHPPPKMTQAPTFAIVAEMRRYLAAKNARFAVGLTDADPPLQRFLDDSKIPWVALSTSLRYGKGDHWTVAGQEVVSRRIENFLSTSQHFTTR